eukprot:gene12254-13516_t
MAEVQSQNNQTKVGKNKFAGRSDNETNRRSVKQLSKKEIQRLNPLERSRYLAYEEPAKDVLRGIEASRKRIAEAKQEMKRLYAPIPIEDALETEKHEQLIGQLKAAEARNRARLLRLHYQRNRGQEVSHLISCQPTAIKAMRLQTLLPPYPKKVEVRDMLGKDERIRVESLLADEIGLETERKLT